MASRRGVYVVKIGGSVIGEVDPSLAEDVKWLISEGYRVVLVHGGGDYVTEVAEKLGKRQVFVTSPEGIRSRYTDRETAEIYTMVMSGLLSKRVVASLGRLGVRCVSLSGLDGGLLRAERKKRLVIVDERGRRVAVEGGYTGRIVSVDTRVLEAVMDSGFVPVVSPVAFGEEYEFLNVDSDRACASIAGALRAEAAVFLTDVEGVVFEGSVVGSLSVPDARALVSRVGGGMDVKLIAAVEAVEGGAKLAVISSGLRKNPVKTALAGAGTRVLPAG